MKLVLLAAPLQLVIISDLFYCNINIFLFRRLDLNKLKWKILPFGSNPKTKFVYHPMNVEKTVLASHNHFLYTFGGYGDRPENHLISGKGLSINYVTQI